eukprot:1603843-Amphidinium_carterae.1
MMMMMMMRMMVMKGDDNHGDKHCYEVDDDHLRRAPDGSPDEKSPVRTKSSATPALPVAEWCRLQIACYRSRTRTNESPCIGRLKVALVHSC